MRKRQVAATLLQRGGGLKMLDAYWGVKRLTVLAYHRILDWTAPDFTDFEPNVSASPDMFTEQMAYVSKNFNVISLDDLHYHIISGASLPERPLLITFDDGYLDNYEHALPVLKYHNFPAVVFIVTSRMTNPSPLWWDECAYYFHATDRTDADLPFLGYRTFTSHEDRMETRDEQIEALKKIPETAKQQAMVGLSDVLEVSLSARPPVFISWDQAREMVEAGVTCQPHTVNHPILTRIDSAEAFQQIQQSRQMIEQELGYEASAFAYPNGMPDDYNLVTLEHLKNLRFTSAFTLTPGPMKLEDVRRYPYQIKRVFLSYKDTLEIFATKIMGLPALLNNIPYLQES